ncbi:baseplate J/gp47 family protein [Komagataeibacter intermedius]|uniref:baseplate J/gp47 family protein n=1 Tax=Komagataeibacter intermedius TaxID=66229 RepID=UPI003B431BB8
MGSVSSVSDLACSVSASGITAPDYSSILTWLKDAFWGIYGSDVSLDNSTQDGQWLGIIAQAINASNNAMIATFNSFSPSTAQGTGLSSVVKINGIARNTASYSTCDVIVSGAVGTIISGGSVKDSTYDYTWDLPSSVAIPDGGQITVTATCETEGAITVAAGTLTTINTPTRGWTSVTNTTASSPGVAIETDAALRKRQASSTMTPSYSIMDGLIGSIEELTGVSAATGYENDTDATDSNGIPAGYIAIVVEGGDASDIATVIANKKSMGVGTVGNTSELVTDSSGTQRTINFYRPDDGTITVEIGLTALTGYTDAIGTLISEAVADYISGLPIGSTIYTTRLYKPATLDSDDGGDTYDITSITLAVNGGALSTANIELGFYEMPLCTSDDVTIVASAD